MINANDKTKKRKEMIIIKYDDDSERKVLEWGRHGRVSEALTMFYLFVHTGEWAMVSIL